MYYFALLNVLIELLYVQVYKHKHHYCLTYSIQHTKYICWRPVFVRWRSKIPLSCPAESIIYRHVVSEATIQSIFTKRSIECHIISFIMYSAENF